MFPNKLFKVVGGFLIFSIVFGLSIHVFQFLKKKNIETQMIAILKNLHTAADLYKSKNGKYLVASLNDHRSIEEAFRVDLSGKDLSFSYLSENPDEFEFTCEYYRSGFYFTGDNFTLRSNQTPINTNKPEINPCCISDGLCPSLKDCS